MHSSPIHPYTHTPIHTFGRVNRPPAEQCDTRGSPASSRPRHCREDVPMTASKTPRRVAMLTGGGDAPGMNAALRAVASMALNQDPAWSVHGIRNGFWGLLSLTDPNVAWSDVAEPMEWDTLSWAVREG